jgi:hypothetical protein
MCARKLAKITIKVLRQLGLVHTQYRLDFFLQKLALFFQRIFSVIHEREKPLERKCKLLP